MNQIETFELCSNSCCPKVAFDRTTQKVIVFEDDQKVVLSREQALDLAKRIQSEIAPESK